jgi:protein-tyrosine phosphatase
MKDDFPVRRQTLLLAAALSCAPASAAAAPDQPAGASVERTAPDRLLLRWDAAAPVDVYVGTSPSATPPTMRLISDDDADGRHEAQVPRDARPYFLLQPASGGTGVRVAERFLPLEGGSNFRDIGGYPAANGKHVRWGKIYRTGAMPKLTDSDYDYLAGLGIEVVCDLRSTEERQLSPTNAQAMGDARYVAVDYPASDIFRNLVPSSTTANTPSQSGGVTSLYREWPVSLAPQYKAIFDGLLAGEAPLAFHCSAGQDRTGVATAMVLTALGVPRDVIYADYHLSTSYRRPEFEFADVDLALAATNIVARYQLEALKRGAEARRPQPLLNAAGEPRLAETFAEIEGRWGTVEAYLDQVLGVDAADIAELRAMYLE